ncbi:uncharacterized protein LOC129971406 [Argiope bruennichi]|uniref:uncharacterized protein LOC129971406 n=1 Tax=Argiope bruennichi TaxID=94029 RepID=UPI002494E405|nr:uncharacterized protein LOC129971406 [Argiope bruennichi]XP_055941137.1 uncharacterized protein LOC129971406 [Argiope bruennichi]
MARLAAYYQEDFHYPAVGYAPKQRKSTYVLYEEPKNHLCRGHLTNGGRIRSLAASEPVLSPKFVHPSETDGMTLKQRPLLYGSQLIESPHSSVQHFDNAGRNSSTNNRLAGYETNIFDNDSMSSFGEMLAYDNRYLHRPRPQHKDRPRQRFSYAEPNSSHVPHQHFTGHEPQRTFHEAEFTNYDKRLLHPDNCFIESSERDLSPHTFYRPESRQGKWHWVSPHSSFLSPPSPLDSGLSSQSITSSPSLEAEPISFRGEAFRNEGHPRCLCPKVTYPESKGHLYPLNRYDSGRISPGARSVSHHSHVMANDRNRISNSGKAMSYVGDDFYNNDHQFSQIRYGKLGIVGEPTDAEQIIASRKRLDNFREQSYPQNNLENKISYSYAAENGIPPPKPHRHKSQKCAPNYTKPCLIIIESPEKSDSSDGTSSPDREHSDKSPGPESPMSVTASNSASESPSVSSSNNELDIDDRRKSCKRTESEIRELEDMYKKCNLNDRDLLDRAERRDLPTPHQERVGHRLMRSNSDTLYEVMSPVFHNPYETPHRAPPLRRSGLPDRIADDMALRKLQKPVSSSSFNPVDNTITYMLCSTHFTPSVPVGKDILFKDYPDVELDDFSYRKHYFGKKNKIMDPQPPFGIPLRPPPPQKVFTDYLHVAPSNVPQPLCHARRNPDVVRDDLAFRTLRKEEPERMYYDISQFYKKSKR